MQRCAIVIAAVVSALVQGCVECETSKDCPSELICGRANVCVEKLVPDPEPGDPPNLSDDAEGEDEGEGGNGPTPGGGSSSDPSGICSGGLNTYDTGKMYLFGSIVERGCEQQSVSQPETPHTFGYGLNCISMFGIMPTGQLAYVSGNLVKLFTANFMLPDEQGVCQNSTRAPGGDDVAYLDVSSKCGGLGLKEIIPLSDGNIVFRCDNSPDHFIGQDTPFHSAELGALVTVGNGTSHTRLVVSQSGIFSLLATNDAETPVTGLPAGISVIHARTHGTGFALYGSVQGEMQLWHVASSGAATAAGTYGQPPEGFVPDPVGRIDGAGKLYTLGSGPDGRVVLRFDPTGAEGKVIFDDAAQRAEDASSAHPRLRNLLSRGTLFTGP